jgi:hypothetical protein
MREIYLAELRRFSLWARVFALLHLAALAFCLRLIDPLQQKEIFYQLIGCAYGVVGLLFGLYQMGSYRRPNLWLQLLHRPVPAQHIGLALILAAATLLLLVVALPLLLAVLGQDWLTGRVVDLRHYLLPLAVLLIVVCCHLAAAYAMLAPRRYSACLLMLPLLLLNSDASGLAALVLQSLAVIWGTLAVLDAFKPDLAQPPQRPTGTLLVALPLQLGLYVLLVFGGFAYQLGWIVAGTHPLNGVAPSGGYVEATRADSASLIDAALAQSNAPEATLWRQQIRISQSYALNADISGYQRRHELTNLSPSVFIDAEHRLMWTFSDDSMRFQGLSLVDHRARGSLGIGSEQRRFSEPPRVLGAELLISADTLYVYDKATPAIHPRIQLPAGETLAGLPLPIGEALVLLSDQAIYFYAAREYAQDLQLLQPRLRVALGEPVGSLSRVDLVELLDGYLISLLYGRGSTDGPGYANQVLIHTDAQGHAEVLAQRALNPDFPLALRYYAWWLSPALSQLRQLAVSWLGQPQPLLQRSPVATPASMQVLALTLMLLSALGSVWLGRRQALRPVRRWLWVLACALLSVPALLSQRLLYQDDQRLSLVRQRAALAAARALAGDTAA